MSQRHRKATRKHSFSNEEAAYVPVEDEDELAAVMKIFEEMLDDIDIR